MRFRLASSLTLALCLFSLCIRSAFAHATPVSYSPEEASVLSAAPRHIAIRFSERADPKASSIVIYAPDGSQVQSAKAAVGASDPRLLSVPVHIAGSGTYTVSWQVVSADDGHFTKGAYGFSVGAASLGAVVNAQFGIEHSSAAPEAIAVWLELLGHALLVGSLALIFALRKTGIGGTDFARLRRPRSWLTIFGVALGILGACAYIALKSQALASAQDTAWLPALTDFLQTVAGRYALMRAGITLVYAVFFFRWRKDNHGRDVMLIGLLILWAILRARVSHAAASQLWPAFSIGINAAHLLGKELWIGGLIAFVACIRPLDLGRRRKETALAFAALGILTALGVAIGGASGAYIVWLHLKSFANLWTTLWGNRLVALTGTAAFLLILSLHRQAVFGRTLRRLCAETASREDHDDLAAEPFPLLLEMLCGTLVLLLSSLLIITTPPLNTQSHLRLTAESQGTLLTLEPHPFDDRDLLLTIDPPIATNAIVTLTNTQKNIGPIVAPLEKRFEGGYSIAKNQFSPPGEWTIDITVQRQGSYDATAAFQLHYPQDLPPPPVHGGLDTFMIACIVIAVLSLLGGWWLYRQAKRLHASAIHSGESEIAGWSDKQLTISVSLAVFILLLYSAQFSHAHGTFGTLCAQNGHAFHENVPMRGGVALSDMPVLGCMTGMGASMAHFADMREYAYYARPVKAVAALTIDPAKPRANQPASLTFSINDTEGKPVADMVSEHDRILHVIVIGPDLRSFAHIHAETAGPITQKMLIDATFPVRHTFTQPGRHLIAADYAIRASLMSDQFYADIGGTGAVERQAETFAREGAFDGYHVRLVTDDDLVFNRPVRLRYVIERDEKPVTDLQPYLSAAMHVAVVRDDLRKFVHAHGMLPLPWTANLPFVGTTLAMQMHMPLPEHFGPAIDAIVSFPSSGTYIVFGEFKHAGKTVVTRFAVKVSQ